MKLVADEETAAWLAERPAFQRDAGDSTKSQVKHGHPVEEIESMMEGLTLLAGRIIETDRGEPRWLLLGTSASGKAAGVGVYAAWRFRAAHQLSSDAEEREETIWQSGRALNAT